MSLVGAKVLCRSDSCKSF